MDHVIMSPGLPVGQHSFGYFTFQAVGAEGPEGDAQNHVYSSEKDEQFHPAPPFKRSDHFSQYKCFPLETHAGSPL